MRTPAAGQCELGTMRLIRHVAALDRLMRGPRHDLGAVLERELGGETTRLALAAAGCGGHNAPVARRSV